MQTEREPAVIMTTPEVAAYLRCSSTWVAGLVNTGRLPVITLGPEDRPKTRRGPRMWRFRRSDVEQFINDARIVMRDADHAGEGVVKSPAHIAVKPPLPLIPGWDGISRLKRPKAKS